MTSTVLIALAGLALLLLLEGHVRLSRVLHRRRSPPPFPTTGPSITVIRPVRGMDPGAEDNIRAFLELEYPGRLELLFVVDSVEDPAYAAIQRLIAEHPTRAQRVELLLSGMPPPRRTGKLNAMLVGVAAATGELLAFNDSDSRPSKDLLGRLVSELLARPDCGCTFAPVVASAEHPTASDVGYGLLVNAWYGPNVTWAAEPRGELDFIMGQLMVCRRPALDAVGGVGVAEGHFVDDMYIGRALWRAGWKNVVIPAPLRLVIGGMGPLTFFKTLPPVDPLLRGWPVVSLHLARMGPWHLVLDRLGSAGDRARHRTLRDRRAGARPHRLLDLDAGLAPARPRRPAHRGPPPLGAGGAPAAERRGRRRRPAEPPGGLARPELRPGRGSAARAD